MTQDMQRLTTEYVLHEDRIRLSGEVARGAPVVVWLTLRLLQRLLPAVLAWLEGHSAETVRPDLVHSFAQEAAKAALLPQAPVRAVADSTMWLAQSVDLARSAQALCLTFRSADGQFARVPLDTKQLRQWLSIVHGAYQKAGWPLDVWPAWLGDNAQTVDHAGSVVLH